VLLPLGLLTLAFLCEVLILPRPDPTVVATARVLTWLNQDRASWSEISLNGRTMQTKCEPRWIEVAWRSAPIPGELVISSQGWQKKIPKRLRRWPVVSARSPQGRRALEYQLAACPGVLAAELAHAAEYSKAVVTPGTTGSGRPDYRFSLGRFKRIAFYLYVRRSDYRPLRVVVRGRRAYGVGVIAFHPHVPNKSRDAPE
jgi:hypothetical protein